MGILKNISSKKLSEEALGDDSWHLADQPEPAPAIAPAADARPCDVCSFVGHWLDYEGQRRCVRCCFPPTLSIVQSFVGAVELSDGVYGWADVSEEMAPVFANFYGQQRRDRADAEAAASLADF